MWKILYLYEVATNSSGSNIDLYSSHVQLRGLKIKPYFVHMSPCYPHSVTVPLDKLSACIPNGLHQSGEFNDEMHFIIQYVGTTS